MINRWIITLIVISSLNLIAADPATRALGQVAVDDRIKGIITTKEAYKDFCEKYKGQKFIQQEIDFSKEFIYFESYCCSGHTRRGNLNLKVMNDGKKVKILPFPTNRRGCIKQGKIAGVFAIDKGNITELIDSRNQSYTVQ